MLHVIVQYAALGNATCSMSCVCCKLNTARCMSVLAPATAVVADGVARGVRRRSLGHGSVTPRRGARCPGVPDAR